MPCYWPGYIYIGATCKLKGGLYGAVPNTDIMDMIQTYSVDHFLSKILNLTDYSSKAEPYGFIISCL